MPVRAYIRIAAESDDHFLDFIIMIVMKAESGSLEWCLYRFLLELRKLLQGDFSDIAADEERC
jgi:hypothetical protein